MTPQAITTATAVGEIPASAKASIQVVDGEVGQVLQQLNDGDQFVDTSYVGTVARTGVGLQIPATAGNPNDAGQPMGLAFRRLNGQNLKTFIDVEAAAWDAVYEDIVAEACNTCIKYSSNMGTPDIIIRNLRHLGQWNGVDVSDPDTYKLILNECSAITVDNADFEWITGGVVQIWGGGGSEWEFARTEHWNPNNSPFASLQGEHEINDLDLNCIPLAAGVDPATAYLQVLDLGVPFDRNTRLRVRVLHLNGRLLDPRQESDSRLVIDDIEP